MKQFTLFFCLIALLSSCKKSKEETKALLDIPFSFSTKNDFTLPAIPGSIQSVPDSIPAATIKTDDIKNTIPDEFKKNNTDINKLKSISIEAVVLTAKTPIGQTFAFLKSIKIYLGSNGKGEKLIATKDNINLLPASSTLSLDTQNADIVEFIKSPTYFLRIETKLKETYNQDIELGSEIKFRAVANPAN